MCNCKLIKCKSCVEEADRIYNEDVTNFIKQRKKQCEEDIANFIKERSKQYHEEMK
jgi:hypothetical protein